MKSLKSYINERYTTIEDDATGEYITIWVDDEDEGIINKRLEQAEQNKEEYLNTENEWKSLRDKLWDLEDKKDDLVDEIRSLKANYKQLSLDMDDELGQLISKGEDPDKKAQEYGKEMEEILSKKEKLVKELKKIDSEIYNLNKKLNKLF